MTAPGSITPPATDTVVSRAQFAEVEARCAELLKQKTEAEQALTRAREEKDALAKMLTSLDAELGATVVESTRTHIDMGVASLDLLFLADPDGTRIELMETKAT